MNAPAEDPFVPQVALTFATNKAGARVEIEFPEGTELDEKNPLHILAWYICHGFGDLLPVAINSWHTHRREILRAQAAVPVEEAVLVAGPRILGADAKPIN